MFLRFLIRATQPISNTLSLPTVSEVWDLQVQSLGNDTAEIGRRSFARLSSKLGLLLGHWWHAFMGDCKTLVSVFDFLFYDIGLSYRYASSTIRHSREKRPLPN